MRLDRFLRDSRLVKRRAAARSLADEGAVHIEGRAAKASSRVEAGDVLRVRLGSRTLRLRVLGEAASRTSKKEAAALFEILEESRSGEEARGEPSGGVMDFLKRA